MKNKCYNCASRTVGCHGSCPDYAEFRRGVDATNAVRRAARDSDNLYAGYFMDQAAKRRK